MCSIRVQFLFNLAENQCSFFCSLHVQFGFRCRVRAQFVFSPCPIWGSIGESVHNLFAIHVQSGLNQIMCVQFVFNLGSIQYVFNLCLIWCSILLQEAEVSDTTVGTKSRMGHTLQGQAQRLKQSTAWHFTQPAYSPSAHNLQHP